MKIKKFGHSCMLISEGGINILTDPGSYTAEAAGKLTGVDVILIRDEHQDHFDLGSIKALVKNNPRARVITQKSVNKLLAEQGIKSEILLDKQQLMVGGVSLEGRGEKHALLDSSFPSPTTPATLLPGGCFIRETR